MPSEPLLLAFDTSAAHCAAALLRGQTLLGARAEPMARGQAERLIPLLEEVLAGAGVGWRDLDALAVGTGPGNFTGIRIAVAAARGLALGLGRPAIGVSVPEARAEGMERPLCVVEQAPRGQVCMQRFDPDASAPRLVALTELAGHAASLPLAGSAAQEAHDLTGQPLRAPRYPLAEGIARVAVARLGSAQPRPAPFYLRPPDAAPPAEAPPVLLP